MPNFDIHNPLTSPIASRPPILAAPSKLTLSQRSVLAHGGEDHGSTAQPKASDSETTPVQSEPQNNEATASPSGALDATTTEGNATTSLPSSQQSLLAQLPTVGFAEFLFGLILIAPFGLTLLRRRAQHARKSLGKSLP